MFEYRKDVWGRGVVAETGLRAQVTLAELAFGLVAGTQVGTQHGWCDVADVSVGDQVLTFDGGLQTVVSVDCQTLTTNGELTPADASPLFVPAEALGNKNDMFLLPQHSVMIESDVAEEVFNDPFVMVPALSLEGFRGIARMPPPKEIDIITLCFAQDEVVFTNSGALLLCQKSFDILDAGLSVYSALPYETARGLISIMALDDLEATERFPETRTAA